MNAEERKLLETLRTAQHEQGDMEELQSRSHNWQVQSLEQASVDSIPYEHNLERIFYSKASFQLPVTSVKIESAQPCISAFEKPQVQG